MLGQLAGAGVRMVMRTVFSAALLAVTVTSAQAQDLPQGEYTGRGDGTTMSMSVAGGHAKITVSGQGCVGAGEGPISTITDDHWRITMMEYGECLVDVKSVKSGYELDPQPGGQCWQYSGQACGFWGQVSQ